MTGRTSLNTIQTARLTLHLLKHEDCSSLYKIYQSDGVLEYFPNPFPPSMEKVERFIAMQQKHWQEFGYGNWVMMIGEKSEIIGWAGLQYVPELDETEVGYLLDRSYWGRGFATEAAQASLQFGFERHNLDHVIALVHPKNLASIRVIEKCSMKYQDTLELWGIKLMRFFINNSL
jgi:ribosomal-protein-alanine N-acetyltransferase